jgi:hypothetical protein
MTGGMDRSASEIAATWDMTVLITSIKPSERKLCLKCVWFAAIRQDPMTKIEI